MEFAALGYAGMFVSALVAATILPLGSEVVLVSLLSSGYNAPALLVLATTGNTLGALVNYALGRWAGPLVLQKWLKMSDNDLRKATSRYSRYGKLSLCFSWLPVIGDPITVLAGTLRVPLVWFIPLVALGKGLRYLVIIAAFDAA